MRVFRRPKFFTTQSRHFFENSDLSGCDATLINWSLRSVHEVSDSLLHASCHIRGGLVDTRGMRCNLCFRCGASIRVPLLAWRDPLLRYNLAARRKQF